MWVDYIRCAWCGTPIYNYKRRFCSDKCKMAHHRAYNKYVTLISSVVKIKVTERKSRGKKSDCKTVV